MLIYSHTVTPRLQYVTAFLSQYYGTPFLVTTDWQYFENTDKAKINYSVTNAGGHTLFIQPHGLLFETGIQSQTITCFEHVSGYKAFFASAGVMGFDLFSALFYLLSRYEEYLSHQKDMYGRYAHENSLAFQNGFLHLPLVNIWLEDFRKCIEQIPNTKFQNPKFQFLPTYDIDIAWSYRHKGLLRNAGGAVKSMVNGRWAGVKERVQVLVGKEQDPYDCYQWLDDLHQQYDLQPLYFFHVGQQRNQYDKNIPTANKAFQQLVQQHAGQYAIGLHPSWHSGDAHAYLLQEKEILEAIAQRTVTTSRQHYLRFTLPHTFRRLLEVGITYDYSMGYGSINGFRASVATAFYWYDLEKEMQTGLLLHPLCFMEANSFYEQRLSAEAAYDELLHYYQVVKRTSGTLITIWHNQFLGTDPLFAGWRDVYQRFINTVIQGVG